MFLVFQNSHILATSLLVSLLYAIIYICVRLLLCRPCATLSSLLATQHKTKGELAAIKSVQQDFVRHSRLNRKVIQLEKEVVAKKAEDLARIAQHKSNLFYAKVLLLVGVAAFFYRDPVLLCDSAIFWPLFSGGTSVTLPAWAVALISLTGSEHLASTMLPLLT